MGAKLFTPNVGKNFGEAFLSTIDRERKLRQQQQQFNQGMAFRNRQLGFLNGYRDSLIEQNKAQEDRLREQFEFNKEQALKPQEQKPTKQFLRSETGGGVQSDFYGYDVGTDEEDVVLDIKRRNLPKTEEKTSENTQSPHISSIKLDEAYGQYKSYDDNYNKSLKEGEKQTVIDAGGNQVILTKEQLKAGRDSHRKTFMIHANNRADALEKTYKGFEAFYNDFRDREDLKGAVSPGRLMDIISTDMAGFPADAIREMFELIVKTNG